MKKFVIATVLAFAPILGFAAPAFADSPGQLSNGATNYEVKNVTRGGAYGQTADATCNETVKFSVLLANSDFGLLKNLTVKANLGSGAISASATNAADAPTSVSGSAKVNLAKGSLSYVAGSTVRISSDGATRTPLADGVTTTGVNAGELKGSTQTFVQFDAKVTCDTTPPVIEKDITVCDLSSKKVITIKESAFDSKKHSKNLADCASTPAEGEVTVCEVTTGNIVNVKKSDANNSKYTTDLSKCAKTVTPVAATELPQTGAASVMTAGAVLSVLTAAGAYALQRRNILG